MCWSCAGLSRKDLPGALWRHTPIRSTMTSTHGSGTFAGQSALPKLPIPTLKITCERYLKAVSVLLTPEQMSQTTAAVEAFLQGPGPRLQERLVTYAADRPSYIEDFWFDAYLTHENSVVLNVPLALGLRKACAPCETVPLPSSRLRIHTVARIRASLPGRCVGQSIFRARGRPDPRP